MVHILQRGERLDNLLVRLVLLELGAVNGQRDRINAESGAGIGGVQLDIVDGESQPAGGGHKLPQILAAGELQMD